MYNKPTYWTDDADVMNLEEIRDAMQKVHAYLGDTETRQRNAHKLVRELIKTLSQYRPSGQKRLINEIVMLEQMIVPEEGRKVW